MFNAQEITGLILAGGQARRMGRRDKGLLEIHGKPLIHYVLARLQPQVGAILISANRNQEEYAKLGHTVISDPHPHDFLGPLMGIKTALHHITTPYLLVVPCDAPLLPVDLALNLFAAGHNAHTFLSVAHDGARLQPLFVLIHHSMLVDLEQFLAQGERKVTIWLEKHRFATADFSHSPFDFININSMEDYFRLEDKLC